MGAAQTIKVRLDDRGRQIGDNPALSNMDDLSAAMPPHPIRVGESYSFTKTRSVAAAGEIRTTEKYTLRSFKTVQGVKCAELAYTTVGKSQQFSMNMTGTLLLSTADGTMVKMSGTSTTTISAGAQPMNMSQTVAITRK